MCVVGGGGGGGGIGGGVKRLVGRNDQERAPVWSETTRIPLTTTMADEIPMTPKVGSLIVHSGNIVNWNRLKRKPNQSPTEEVCLCKGFSFLIVDSNGVQLLEHCTLTMFQFSIVTN